MIFVVCGLSLIVTGAVFSYEAMAIPGPLGPAAIGAIIVGVVMILMGVLGYKAAKERKIEGKELKGKCELFLYAGVVFSMFAALLCLSIVLLVWLGGAIPMTGEETIDSLTLSSVEAAQKPVANLVGCVYDSCCFEHISEPAKALAEASNESLRAAEASNASNASNESLWADCFLDKNGVPDHANGDNIKNENGTVTKDAIRAFSDSNKYCDLIEEVRCDQGSEEYREDVGKKIHDKLSPFAYSIVALAGLLLVGWVFAVAEIFWCCGQSDLDEDKTKVVPEYDDY